MINTKIHGFVCTATDYINGIRLSTSDSLVINGFWRSGTTWLQESITDMLNAKSVFEPFNLPSKNILKCLPEIRPPRQDFQFINALMPYVPNQLEKSSVLHHIVQKALKGQLRGRSWEKRSLQDCLSPTVVVKFTRGSLCAHAIANTFSVPVLHLVRDPRAVITSIKSLEDGCWAEGTFNNLSLHQLLLGIDDDRAQYFGQWASDIEAIDKTTDYGKLAGYYCLTEKYLEESFQSYQGKFVTARYEELIAGRTSTLRELLVNLGFTPYLDKTLNLDKPSSTDWDKSSWTKKASKSDRLTGWKAKLNESDRDLVEEIVTAFKMDDRFWD